MGVSDVLFEETANLVADGGVLLKKYKSKTSGLTVCIAEAEGPLVAGYLCVATEAHDDDGLPHTLEHLVFLGSEKYPYKGVLDLLSNLCLASGTNAWTDTDHTCYTMTTAGHEGFLKLLPIYVDHLLYPKLTDAAFVTEVHHVNSEGEDAGVIYAEMQGRVNTGECLCHQSTLRAMYPGDCGYKSETSGRLENLRESVTNEKVKAFHKNFYRPENLCIIIVGQINAEDVFRVLQPIEHQIMSQGDRQPFVRPWQSPVPALLESITINVDYPSDEEDCGLAITAWRGPEVKDYVKFISVEILMEYLMDTSISPLQRAFVETKEPLCNMVDFTVIQNYVSCIYLHFANVPVERLCQIKSKLLKVLGKIVDHSDELDMERMATVIRKKKLHILGHVESNPHQHFAECLIGDFLYGNNIEDLKHRVQQIPILEELLKESAEYWYSLVKLYLIDGNQVVVLGNPSSQLAKEMSEKEKQRIVDQRDKLGPDGLKLKDEILRKSIEANEVPPPDEMMNSISVPSVQSLKLHSLKQYSNVGENSDSLEYFSLTDMPCRFQLDVAQTNFVRMFMLLDTGDVPQNLRMYIPLFVELLGECPILRNGEVIPYEDVVKQLDADTVNAAVHLGMGYSRFSSHKYAQVICLVLKLEEERYLNGIRWIHELLYQTVFEPSRIKNAANKMLMDVSRLRRKGNSSASLLVKNLLFCSESNHWICSMMRQYCFLTNMCKHLESQPDEVVKAFNDLRKLVTQADKLTVHLVVNHSGLRQCKFSEKPWTVLLPHDMKPSIMKSPIKQCYELLNSTSTSTGAIVGLSSIECSYMVVAAPCITSYKHADFPALLVLLQYLIQTEGPLWRKIRGNGLAYGYSLLVRPNEGLVYFHLYRSSLLVKAYEETFKVIQSHLNQEVPWDSSLLESACSSLVFELVEREKTVSDIIEQSVLSYYRGLDMNHTKELLESISKVKPEDMQRVGLLYLNPLFDPKLSKCSISCPLNRVEEIVVGFQKFSMDLTVLSSLEDNFLTSY